MAQQAIFKYMSEQNRPFSSNDIFENLHKEFGKTEVQKTIDKLVEQDKLIEKTYGKQKVYCVKQKEDASGTSNPSSMDSELRELDKTIGDLEQNLRDVEDKLAKNQVELKTLLSTMTTEEAASEKEKLEEEIECLNEKLRNLSGANSIVITHEEKNKIIADNEKITKEYRKRKRICMEIVNSIMEGYPKTKKNLIEEVGLETDEDVGFTLE